MVKVSVILCGLMGAGLAMTSSVHLFWIVNADVLYSMSPPPPPGDMYILLTLLGDPVLGLLWLCVGCIAKNSGWGTSDRPTLRPASAMGQHPGGRPPISPVFFSHCHYAHQHWNYFTNITAHWVAVWEELSENESSYRLQHKLHSTSPGVSVSHWSS